MPRGITGVWDRLLGDIKEQELKKATTIITREFEITDQEVDGYREVKMKSGWTAP